MSESFSNFPKMMQTLLETIAKQKPSLSAEREAAKQKLLEDLKGIIGEDVEEGKEEEGKVVGDQLKNLIGGLPGGQLFSLLSQVGKKTQVKSES